MVWYFLLWCTKLNREVLVFLSKGYHSREENVCPANKTIMCTIILACSDNNNNNNNTSNRIISLFFF